MKPLVLTTLALWLLAAPGAAAADSQEAWAALVNGSHVALIRHGNAPPGYGDPPGFRCLETARLMVLGPVDGTWAVAASDRGPERLAALRQMLADWRGPGTLVVVTHTNGASPGRYHAGPGGDRGGQT